MSEILGLPLFPLELVLYPGERLPLHIFEPRYREMIHFCLETGNPFGVVLEEDDRLVDVGCTAEIDRVLNRYEEGRLDVLIEGVERFHVQRVYHDRDYLTADVTLLAEPEEPLHHHLRERVITQHMRLLELAGRTVRPSLYQDVSALSFLIAANAGLTPRQKQEVLELHRENERIEYLVDYLEALIPAVKRQEELRELIQSNGHFEDFPPEDE